MGHGGGGGGSGSVSERAVGGAATEQSWRHAYLFWSYLSCYQFNFWVLQVSSFGVV